MTDYEKLVAPLLALARHNIPPDVQELLVHGNPMYNIPPGALADALDAALARIDARANEDPEEWAQKLAEEWVIEDDKALL